MVPGGSGSGSPRSDLFLFDRTDLKDDILLHEGKSPIEYREYATYTIQDKAAEPEALRPESAHGRGIALRPFSSRP
jgi:hypothetical protein